MRKHGEISRLSCANCVTGLKHIENTVGFYYTVFKCLKSRKNKEGLLKIPIIYAIFSNRLCGF